MSRLLPLFTSTFTYFAIGTVLSQVILLGVLWQTGMLTREKLVDMLAVAHGVNLAPENEKEPLVPELSNEQPSQRDAREREELISRNIELRMQSLSNNKDEMLRLVRGLKDQMDHYQNVSTAFNNRLDELEQGEQSKAQQEVRLILENAKPKQAKEQLMVMLANGEMREVVTLLSSMPDSKRKNIIAEFKTEEENLKLAEILREIREGGPEVSLIDSTRDQLDL